MSSREKKSEWAKKRRSEITGIPKDIHGWIDAKHKPPRSLHFELVMLQYDTGRIQQGWWAGGYWDCIKRSLSPNVVKWRLLKNEERIIKYKDSGKEK